MQKSDDLPTSRKYRANEHQNREKRDTAEIISFSSSVLEFGSLMLENLYFEHPIRTFNGQWTLEIRTITSNRAKAVQNFTNDKTEQHG